MYEINCYDSYGNTIDYLTQWDYNRKLIMYIEHYDLSYAPEVHFCNQNSLEALVVQSVVDGNKLTVDIPNILLQEPYAIFAYVYLSDANNAASQKTVISTTLPVRRRPKPSDYTYVENISHITAALMEETVFNRVIDNLESILEDKNINFTTDCIIKDVETSDDNSQVVITMKDGVIHIIPKSSPMDEIINELQSHNTSDDAHADIRLLIDGLTNGKVSVSDIVDDLTTNVWSKPLSAKQGAILRTMIDAIEVPTSLSQLNSDSTHRVVTDEQINVWNSKSNFSGDYSDLTGTPSIPNKTSDLTNDSDFVAKSEIYTKTEIDSKGFITQHQDLSDYAKKSQLPTKTSQLTNDSNFATTNDIPTKASDVGADEQGTAQTKVSEHNNSSESHIEMRLQIRQLAERLNTIANSDDVDLDQISELVAYIKANRTLIESITTTKVNVSDIIDNLTSNVSNKPLSAKQGVVLKGLIDAIVVPTLLSQLRGDSTHRLVTDAQISEWDAKSNFSGKYSDLTGVPIIPSKTSQLINDSEFLTEHQSLAEYAKTADHYTKTESDNKYQPKGNYLTQHQDLSGYAQKSEIPSKTSQLLNDSGYVTESHNHIYYGVCSTAADDAVKTVTVDNFSLQEGAMVIVKFTNANSIASPTLNVNNTGDIPIYRYGATVVSTGTTTTGWVAGAIQLFVYDGSGWIRDYWNNTTYSNASLGCGYATCATAASTVAKTATLSSYSLTTGGIVAVKFTNAVPAKATLNINSKGAKNIYYRGAAITTDIIKAGDIATFVYSSQYHLISIDRWQNDINSKANKATTLDGYGIKDAYTMDEINSKFNSINASNILFDSPSKLDLITRGTIEDALLYIETALNDLMINKANKDDAEEWTFTLEDGSTVTKKVVLA